MICIPARARGIAWVVAIVGLVVALIARTPPWFQNDVFDLLPAADYDAMTARAASSAEAALSRSVLFLAGHEDRAVARAGAESIAASLRGHELVDSVTAEVNENDVGAFAEFYFRYRRNLLTPAQLEAIGEDGGASVRRNALAAFYSPLGTVGSDTLLTDPFVLLPDSMRALQSARGAAELDGGYIAVADGPVTYMLVSARTASLDMDSQQRLAGDIESYRRSVENRFAGTTVLSTGFLYFANAGAQSARAEITLIGAGSVVGILALMLWVFRSMQPLLLALLTIASGCLVALTTTLWIFGAVHLFTLVFGASLIGVSIDYTFHYVTEEYFGDRGAGSLAKVLPGITLGLITSVIAYVALTVAPFPGLRQLAVFSSAGLIGACLTLLCCAGWLRAGRRPLDGGFVARLCSRHARLWHKASRGKALAAGAAVGVISLAGISAAEVNDDVAVLQARPAELIREEAEVRRLIADVPSNTFLVARAGSAEQLLVLEESMRTALDELVLQGAMQSYVATSQSVPSAARQRQSLAAYAELVETQLPAHLQSLGVRAADSERIQRELLAPAALFSVEDWLENAAPPDLSGLWLGRVGESFGSIVLLTGAVDLDVLRAAMTGFAEVVVVDQASDLSMLLAAYRQRVSWLLLFGYVAIWLFLSIRYGLMAAAGLVIPPILAGLLALAVSSLAGIPLNLFSMLALILVLGIGIDFTIFLAESRGRFTTTMIAVTLSAITTILSFGLLSLSETNAVRAFGLVVLVGIAGSYFLAPLALYAQPRTHADDVAPA